MVVLKRECLLFLRASVSQESVNVISGFIQCFGTVYDLRAGGHTVPSRM